MTSIHRDLETRKGRIKLSLRYGDGYLRRMDVTVWLLNKLFSPNRGRLLQRADGTWYRSGATRVPAWLYNAVPHILCPENNPWSDYFFNQFNPFYRRLRCRFWVLFHVRLPAWRYM